MPELGYSLTYDPKNHPLVGREIELLVDVPLTKDKEIIPRGTRFRISRVGNTRTGHGRVFRVESGEVILERYQFGWGKGGWVKSFRLVPVLEELARAAIETGIPGREAT